MHHLQRGVLDNVGKDFRWDLFHDNEPLAVGADLREQRGEQVDGGRGRAVGDVLEQPVGLLEDQDVAQSARARVAVPDPQMLHDADQDGAEQERLVLVAGDVLQLEDDVARQQGADVDRMPALEEPTGRTLPQAADAHVDKAPDVRRDLRAVADILDHPRRGALQVPEGRISPAHVDLRVLLRPGHPESGPVRGLRPVQHQVPSQVLVRDRQRAGEHLGERLVRLERRQEQGPDEIDVALQGKAGLGFQRVQRRRWSVEPARPDDEHLGEAGEPPGHPGVLGLGRLQDQPRNGRRSTGQRLQQRPHGL